MNDIDTGLYRDKMRIDKVCCFDIDGVIFENNYPEYDKAEPIIENIKIINDLYDRGYLIVLNTARGYITRENWLPRTEQQLLQNSVKYHYLYANKPAANYYIDDKNASIKEMKELLSK